MLLEQSLTEERWREEVQLLQIAKTALQKMLLCHIDAAAMSPCVNARHDPVGFRDRYSNLRCNATSYVLPNPEHDRENRAIRSMPLHVIVHNPPGMNNQVPVRFFEWGWVKDVEKIGPLPTQKV